MNGTPDAHRGGYSNGYTAGVSPRRQLVAASLANVFEYYDFVIYAFLASAISHSFFPLDDEIAGLLATFGAFGVGFLARPVGAVIIGRMADRRGRKVALLAAVFGMAVGTVGIGLLPTFGQIGRAAPVLLVTFRLLQGLCAGGGWGSGTSFVVESAPPGQRGLYGSVGQACITSSTLLGSTVAATINVWFTPAAVDAWAWRIPFLLGILLVPVGLYMRRGVVEPAAFADAQAASTPPLDTRTGALLVSKAFGFAIVWTVSFYLMLSYMPTFTSRYGGLTPGQALWTNSAALVVLVLTIPAFGWLSDRIGRKPLLLACCIGFTVLSYPLFRLISTRSSLLVVLLVQVTFNLLIAAFSGAGPAALAELFPTRARTTLMSIGYSMATAVFGGFAPFAAVWLIARTGSPESPSVYLGGAAVVSGLVIWRFRETAFEGLA